MNCKICPMQCKLIVEEDKTNSLYRVRGNKCPQGEKYALKEMAEPSRVVFSRVLLDNGPMSRLHVKTDAIVANNLKDKFIEIIENTRVQAPISRGEIIIENILDTGINVISARKVNRV